MGSCDNGHREREKSILNVVRYNREVLSNVTPLLCEFILKILLVSMTMVLLKTIARHACSELLARHMFAFHLAVALHYKGLQTCDVITTTLTSQSNNCCSIQTIITLQSLNLQRAGRLTNKKTFSKEMSRALPHKPRFDLLKCEVLRTLIVKRHEDEQISHQRDHV